jgi:hypothetical protein
VRYWNRSAVLRTFPNLRVQQSTMAASKQNNEEKEARNRDNNKEKYL